MPLCRKSRDRFNGTRQYIDQHLEGKSSNACLLILFSWILALNCKTPKSTQRPLFYPLSPLSPRPGFLVNSTFRGLLLPLDSTGHGEWLGEAACLLWASAHSPPTFSHTLGKIRSHHLRKKPWLKPYRLLVFTGESNHCRVSWVM